MQCWAAINHLGFDDQLPYVPHDVREAAIHRTLNIIEREYRVLAGWRGHFNV